MRDLKQETSFVSIFYEQLKFCAQLSWAWKKFIISEPDCYQDCHFQLDIHVAVFSGVSRLAFEWYNQIGIWVGYPDWYLSGIYRLAFEWDIQIDIWVGYPHWHWSGKSRLVFWVGYPHWHWRGVSRLAFELDIQIGNLVGYPDWHLSGISRFVFECISRLAFEWIIKIGFWVGYPDWYFLWYYSYPVGIFTGVSSTSILCVCEQPRLWQLCADSSEPLLLTDARRTKISCIGSYVVVLIGSIFQWPHMGESSKFPKSWTLEIQILKLAGCLQKWKKFKFKWLIVFRSPEN